MRRIQSTEMGYTLIEMVVVVVLLAILMIAVMGLFLTILKNGGKASALARVKEEGDYAVTTIERRLRYATRIILPGDPTYAGWGGDAPICKNTTDDLTNPSPPLQNYIYYLEQGAPVKIYQDETQILIDTGNGNESKITSNKVSLVGNLAIACYRQTTVSGAVVQITFTLQDKQEANISQKFTSRVVLRNY